MDTMMETGDCFVQEEESAWNEEVDITQLCRICANPSEYLIPIFEGEGVEHELEKKIEKHLPIKVSRVDELPTNLCYQCASTLIAWHDMVVSFVEADDKLKAVIHSRSKVLHEKDSIAENDGNSKETITTSLTNNTVPVSKVQEPVTSDDADDAVEEEEMSSIKPEITENENDETTDTRLGSFKAYHQTQVTLRMLQWASRGSVYCVICGEMRENQMSLMKHLYNEHRMQCGHCDARFTDQLGLARHMLTHGTETSRSLQKRSHMFECDNCPMSFLRRFDLKKHKIKFHPKVNYENKENGKLKCSNANLNKPKEERSNVAGKNQCGDDESHYMSESDDSDRGEFTNDVFVNAEVKLYEAKYFCTSCDYSCKMKRELVLHERNIHSTRNSEKNSLKRNKPHYCELCRNSYMRKTDLQRHILKMHSSEEFSTTKIDTVEGTGMDIINRAKENINGIVVYHCNVCGKNLRTKKGFIRHVRVHTGERPFTCHICGKQYRSSTDLSRHLKCVHEGIKKYQCDLCGQLFANKGTRNDHRRTHTGERPYMCDVCGKSFPTPNSIYIHRRTHTNHFPHECQTCEKKFRRKQQLVHHTRTHTGERPHACDLCGKCFAVKDEVARHKLTHSNEKPYICPTCGLAFAQKRYLTSHIKTHHPGLT